MWPFVFHQGLPGTYLYQWSKNKEMVVPAVCHGLILSHDSAIQHAFNIGFESTRHILLILCWILVSGVKKPGLPVCLYKIWSVYFPTWGLEKERPGLLPLQQSSWILQQWVGGQRPSTNHCGHLHHGCWRGGKHNENITGCLILIWQDIRCSRDFIKILDFTT